MRGRISGSSQGRAEDMCRTTWLRTEAFSLGVELSSPNGIIYKGGPKPKHRGFLRILSCVLDNTHRLQKRARLSDFRKKSIFLLCSLLTLAAMLLLLWLTHVSLPWENPVESERPEARAQSARNSSLENKEKNADRTFWAKEMLAESCGRVFESLWDSLNATTNKWEVLAGFQFQEIVLPDWGAALSLPHGIELRTGSGVRQTLSREVWGQRIAKLAREGWQLDNIEFRHNQFDTDENRNPWRSRFYFAARLTQPGLPQRAIVEGDLTVDWWSKRPGEESAPVKTIDATHLNVRIRVGDTPFQRILEERIAPVGKSPFIDPLILYDLDGDGLSEIVLVAANLVYHRNGEDRYEAQPLCRYPLDFITTAVIAYFDGDGIADLLCANFRGLSLFKGSPQGTFDEPARLVWQANPPLKNAMVLTCGDIDKDGDLDVFVGQYRLPDLGQVLRPYYYDANDGWPSYLLLNDGHGNFTDATEAAGLGPKRWRRTYGASLVDLDGDGHLDLSVVNDFAGLDLYKSDGRGHFTDVTRQWVDEPHAFGMAQALADFNVD